MGRANDDAIVLGADLEGLVAAATLARAGRAVHLVDDGAPIGGTAAAREIHPGYRAAGILNETGLIRRNLLAPLELEGAGLAWHPEVAPLTVLTGGEPALEVPYEIQAASNALGADGEPHREWRGFLDRLSKLVADIVDEAPP